MNPHAQRPKDQSVHRRLSTAISAVNLKVKRLLAAGNETHDSPAGEISQSEQVPNPDTVPPASGQTAQTQAGPEETAPLLGDASVAAATPDAVAPAASAAVRVRSHEPTATAQPVDDLKQFRLEGMEDLGSEALGPLPEELTGPVEGSAKVTADEERIMGIYDPGTVPAA